MRIFPLFKRFFWLFAAAGVSTLCAQQTVSFTVSTAIPGANFTVDGATYTTAAQFQWPAGSKHIVSYFVSQLPAGTVVNASSNGVITPLQLSQNGTELYTFGGWLDNTGFLSPSADATQVVTANGTVTSLIAQLTLSYRVLLSFEVTPNKTVPPSCGAPGSTPPTGFFPGIVYVNNICYWNSAILYFPAKTTLSLNAFPLPGFVFLGWSSNLGSNDAYLRSYVLNGPVEIAPMFGPGKRVRVETNPLGLNVLIDRTTTPTLSYDIGKATCNGENLPIPVASYDTPLCFGDFDFAPGSKHLVAAPSPVKDINGKVWIFNSWASSSGQGGQLPNTVYTTDNKTANSDKIIVSFDPGVQASFVTTPVGLKLNIDGRDNWPGYNFIWALGSTHQVTAAAQQADATGRQYTWSGWSNGGGATQTVTMDPGAAAAGFRMVANYNKLSRLVVQTAPAGQTVQVDGASCTTPCNVDRANGAQVHITAAPTLSLGTGARLDFSSWSDAGAADHMYQISGDLQTVTANYNTLYQLTASGNPTNGVKLAFSPASPDGFYRANTNVTVTATANSGFKFRRWGGDLSGTYPAGTLSMTGPHAAIALLDRIPYIAPAGVENGAGATPDAVVAPGSIAMILGESLAPDVVVGPVNPLAQTIDNVTVTLGTRLIPLFSVTPQQITILLPSDLTPGNYTLQVQSPGQPIVTSDFTVVRDAPGVFTNPANSKSYILALHHDGTLVTAAKPAKQGEQITFFGTGFGPYRAPIIDGFFPPVPPPAMADPVRILAAGHTLQPDSAGAAAGYTGLVSVKFTITNVLPAATEVNLQVEINGRLSNTVVLPVQ